MSILPIIITIVIVGVLLWLVNTYVMMDGKIKKILNIVVVILLILWLLRILGAWEYMSSVTI